jgi:hypothetical protein
VRTGAGEAQALKILEMLDGRVGSTPHTGYEDTDIDVRTAGLSGGGIARKVVAERIDFVGSIVPKGNRAVN